MLVRHSASWDTCMTQSNTSTGGLSMTVVADWSMTPEYGSLNQDDRGKRHSHR